MRPEKAARKLLGIASIVEPCRADALMLRTQCINMARRSCRELAVAHRAKLPAQRLFGNRDAELLVDPLRKINQPPAHYTVDRRIGPLSIIRTIA